MAPDDVVVPGVRPDLDTSEITEEPQGEDVHPDDPSVLDVGEDQDVADERDAFEDVARDDPATEDVTHSVAKAIEERRARRAERDHGGEG